MSDHDLRRLIGEETARVRATRHDLHRRPELGYQEHRTSKAVRERLAELGIEHAGGLAGGTGVLGRLPATGGATETAVALRADMDALPIDERTGAEYASETPGVMHACGHDGHTAMLLGAAAALTKVERPRDVTLLFQPAEEGGAGGRRMVEDGALDGSVLGPRVERIYGLHGWPEMELGAVGTIPGPMLAATDDFTVTIQGVGGHAATPHHTRDPVVATAQVVTALQSIASRSADPLDAVVVTIATVHGGTAENIIPEAVEISGTVRSLTEPVRAMVKDRFFAIVQQTSEAMGCRARIDWRQGYPVTRNDEGLVESFHALARDALGPDRVAPLARPIMGGEDFSFYGDHARACFFALGLRPQGGSRPMLHQPDFDFNDAAIPTGVEMLCRAALSL